jgi:hypothetical protein
MSSGKHRHGRTLHQDRADAKPVGKTTDHRSPEQLSSWTLLAQAEIGVRGQS